MAMVLHRRGPAGRLAGASDQAATTLTGIDFDAGVFEISS